MFKDSLIRQTTGDKKNPFRYFSKQELKELFTLEDTHSSSTQLQLQSLHSSVCRSDPELQCHISALKGINVFGVSRHDLLFSNEEHEDTLQDEETHYIEQRVQKAQELVQAESQLHSLMTDNVNQNTEPAWLRLSRQQGPYQHTAMGDGKTTPPCHNLSPPAVVDLTQSRSDEMEMSVDGGIQLKDECVIDLSPQVRENGFVGRVFKSIDEEQSLIVEEQSDDILTHSNHIIHISPLKQSDLSVALLETESTIPEVSLGSHEACVKADSDASKALLGVGLDSSTDSKAETDLSKSVVGVGSSLNPDSTTKELQEPESFQGNFNLKLEDSAELLSEDKQEDFDQEDVEISTGGEDFQLQMDDTREKIEECNFDSVKEKSLDESLLWFIKKKKPRVIYDSEEDGQEEEEAEKPVLASSPLASSFTGLGCSTPKSALYNGTNRRCSMNISIASRRSLVESLLQDMEEDMEEEEEPEMGKQPEDEGSSEGAELNHASEVTEVISLTSFVYMREVSGTYDNESLLEETEPSGETLNSEQSQCEEEQVCEEEEEGGDVKGFTDESTDVELASSEVLDQCAPSEVQNPNYVEHPEESFDSLVSSGRCCLADGRKQEALDFFLKAIDINSGDSEIQLLIIQLYRHLSQ